MPPSPPPDSEDGRVTLAVLSAKLDRLTQDVQDMCGKMDRRMSNIEELLHVETADLRARTQDNATQVARLEERQKATTGILSVLTFVFSSIAATIGALFK